jgi:P-type Cu2+ transporter
MRQNLAWAIGCNALALPIAAGVFEPVTGLVLRPEIAALTMSGSSIIVAANALALKRLHLPTTEQAGPEPAPHPCPSRCRRASRTRTVAVTRDIDGETACSNGGVERLPAGSDL